MRKLHTSLNPGERIMLNVILPENPDPIFRAFVADPSAKLAGRPVSIPAAVVYMPLFDLKHHRIVMGTAANRRPTVVSATRWTRTTSSFRRLG